MWLLGFETDPGAVVLSSKHAVCVPSFLITSQMQLQKLLPVSLRVLVGWEGGEGS